jgi:hypothetical protein
MSGSGICPECDKPIEDHDNDQRKACHDAVSGYRRKPWPKGKNRVIGKGRLVDKGQLYWDSML